MIPIGQMQPRPLSIPCPNALHTNLQGGDWNVTFYLSFVYNRGRDDKLTSETTNQLGKLPKR